MSTHPVRVAISGIGVVSPFGVGRERFWSALVAGESATRLVDGLDPAVYPCRVAAPLPPFGMDDAPAMPNEHARPADSADAASPGVGERADPKRYARVSMAAVVAGCEAWADAGLARGDPGGGVVIGTGAGGIDIGEQQYREYFLGSGRRVTPYAIPVSICGMVSSEVSIALGLRGISHVLSTGCTSSTDAIGYAAALVRSGECDVLLSGGADACVTPGMLFGFSRMRVMSTRFHDRPGAASRPFDRDRDGFVLGEGAYMVVVEREDRARARGAPLYGYIEGYGSTCDAYHRVQMDPAGDEIVRAMRLAVERSQRPLEEVGYINYHGTSTPLNDAIEVRCVRRLLGARADLVPGSSTKSMIGHPQGASGAAGVVASALALSRGVLPPTINQEHPDPACDVDVIPNVSRPASTAVALCNCLGFGSKNSALVLAAPGTPPPSHG